MGSIPTPRGCPSSCSVRSRNVFKPLDMGNSMSIRKAKRQLQKLKESVAPKRLLSQEIFFKFEDETEAESLARHGLEEWPEDAIILKPSAADRRLVKAQSISLGGYRSADFNEQVEDPSTRMRFQSW